MRKRNTLYDRTMISFSWRSRRLWGIVLTLLTVCMVYGMCIDLRAATLEAYINPDTGFEAVVEDNAGLLTGEEGNALREQMKGITEYGNVVFLSTADNTSSAASYAESVYHSRYGSASGTLFLIDMDNRMIYIFSDGKVYKTITKGYANTITDNVYTYASDSDYYTCASKVFEQELQLLQGHRIAQPMKYISNMLLAVVLALLINYFVAQITSRQKKPSDYELMQGIFVVQKLENFNADFTHETRTYSPQSSGSSGGGSGGGGGGSSGGGGGHSF